MFERRRFLSATVASITALSTHSLATAAVFDRDQAVFLAGKKAFSMEAFGKLLGDPFRIFADSGVLLEARLDAIREEGRCTLLDQFSIRFFVSSHTPVDEGMYELMHQELGRFSLYLQPGEAEDGNGSSLTALFSVARV